MDLKSLMERNGDLNQSNLKQSTSVSNQMDTEEFEDYIFFYGVGDDMCRTHAFISLRSHSDECVKFTNISHEPNFKHQAIG